MLHLQSLYTAPLDKLQNVSRRAAPIVTSSIHDADAVCLLQRLRWKDMIAQRQIQEASINDGLQTYK